MGAPADDIDRIMAVMLGAFEPEYCEAWTRRQVEDALLLGTCHYLLAAAPHAYSPEATEQEPPVAGFALSRFGFEEEELLLFAVMPAFRRQGIGDQLLHDWKSAARARGAQRLLLEMRRANPAESLYLRHGFTPIGTRKNYYRTLSGPRIDAITFACEQL